VVRAPAAPTTEKFDLYASSVLALTLRPSTPPSAPTRRRSIVSCRHRSAPSWNVSTGASGRPTVVCAACASARPGRVRQTTDRSRAAGTRRRPLSGGGLRLDSHRLTQPALEHLTVLDPEFLDAARANPVGEANVPAAPRHYAIPEGMPVIVRVPRTPTNHHQQLSRRTSEMSDKTSAMPVPHAGQALIRLYVPPRTGRHENFRLERENRCLPWQWPTSRTPALFAKLRDSPTRVGRSRCKGRM